MKSENIEILGQYRFQEGGSIQLFIGPNMEYGTEHSTQIHEMYHMHLTNMTSFGFVMRIMDLERVFAEETDIEHSRRMRRFTEVMSGRMLEVQEIYANNMELLWVRENIGSETEKKYYDNKPQNYKNYCNDLKIITENNETSTLEKQHQVNLVCMYAMNIDLLSEDFISALKIDELARYFSREQHPLERMKTGVSLFCNCKLEPLVDSFRTDFDLFIERMQMEGILKYTNPQEMKNNFNEMLREIGTDKLSNEHTIRLYQDLMEESIQVFDFSGIKVFRGVSFADSETSGLFVLKNCANLDDPEENCYLIDYIVDGDRPIYIAEEASAYEMAELIRSKLCIAVRLSEYDTNNGHPKYFDPSGKPLIVLIEDYKECSRWIQNELRRGEVYVGNLYDKTVNNFFTLLFFTRRNDPNTIFVFPTIKRLGMKLIEIYGLNNEVLYSSQNEFLKIFSCLANETEMLKVMHWLLSFLTSSKGDFTTLEDPATKLQFDFIRTLMNSVFQFKNKKHFKHIAALPTLMTIGEPFYTLMEYEGGRNAGILKANGNFPLFFNSKKDALRWLKSNSALGNYRAVGVDNRYWEELKPFLIRTKKKVCICIGVAQRKAILADPVQIDRYMIQKSLEKNKYVPNLDSYTNNSI